MSVDDVSDLDIIFLCLHCNRRVHLLHNLCAARNVVEQCIVQTVRVYQNRRCGV